MKQMTCSCTPLTKYANACDACQRAFKESLRCAEYANQRRIPVEERYNTGTDTDGYGRYLDYTNRMIAKQMEKKDV